MFIYLLIAKKTTTCEYCNEKILPGSRRVSSTRRYRRNSHYAFHRVHYHYQDCFQQVLDNIFAKIAVSLTTTKGAGGRIPLDITAEQRSLRNKMLRRLSYLKGAYQEVCYKVEMSKQTGSTDKLFGEDSSLLKKYGKFCQLQTEALQILEETGGISKNYA